LDIQVQIFVSKDTDSKLFVVALVMAQCKQIGHASSSNLKEFQLLGRAEGSYFSGVSLALAKVFHVSGRFFQATGLSLAT